MKKQDILAKCLEEIQSRRSTLEQCLARYPNMERELRPLLEIALGLKAEELKASAEFKQRARRRLFEEMQAAPARPDRSGWAWPRATALRGLIYAACALLVVAAAGGGTVFAAQGSLPGDPLYPIKTGFENFQLAVTPGAEAKANLHLEIAQKRIEEASQQVNEKHEVDAQALSSVKNQLDQALKELGKSGNGQETSKVLEKIADSTLKQQVEIEQALPGASDSSQKTMKEALDVTRRANLISQTAQANPDFLATRPSVADKNLDGGQFEIEGILTGINGQTWNVGGVSIQNVRIKGQKPAVGTQIKLQGMVKDGEAFIMDIEVAQAAPAAPTKVEGQVGKTNQDGTTEVGGIPVTIAGGTAAPPKAGDKVQVQGDSGNGKMKVTRQESQQDQTSKNTTLKGVLTAVAADGTVTIKIRGSSTSASISQAQIRTQDGRPLKLADLSKYIGQSITLDDLHIAGKMISARQVQIGGD